MAQLKQSLAILAFLYMYCGEFVKNSIVDVSDITQLQSMQVTECRKDAQLHRDVIMAED